MPVFPSQDLYGKKICETYQQLIQIYGNGLVLNGSGSQQQFLNVTASYALNCNCSGSSGSTVAEQFTSSSTWVFTHNLNAYPVLLQTYDYNKNQIVPSNIYLSDNNTAIITFPVSESGWAIASTSGLRVINSGSNLITGSTYPITSSWALYALNGGTSIHTGSTYPITASWALNCVKQPGDSVTGSFCNSDVWTFNHNLGNKYVVIQTYDQNDNQIIPEVINLYDENTAIITFSDDACGIAIASLGGLNVVSRSYYLVTGSTYPITASWAEHTITSSYIQVTGVSYPVRKIYNNYTIVRTTDYTILCDATAGSFNVKLPSPVGNTNIYNIKKIDTTGHDIHVTVTNSSYIDYDLTQSISHRGTNMTVQSDGTNQYWIL
jgi:hypothetical protein